MDGHEVIGGLCEAGRVVLRQCGVRRRRQGYSLEIPYPARLEPQSGGGFCVRFAGFDETFAGGETVGDAPCDAIEALTREARLEAGLAMPGPAPDLSGAASLAPAARTQSARPIRRAQGEGSPADLGRVLQPSWPAAERPEDPRPGPGLRSLGRAAAALGGRLVLRFEWRRPRRRAAAQRVRSRARRRALAEARRSIGSSP